MLPYRDSTLTKIILIVFFVLMFAYGYFEARGFLLGPSIQLDTTVSSVTTPYIKIRGQAQRISSLSMNGQPIPVTEDGSFDQPYLLAAGLNRIVFDAKDTYGRTSRKVVEIVYRPAADASGTASTTRETASTTPQTATSTATSTP